MVFALLAIPLIRDFGIGVFHGVEYHLCPQACSGRIPIGLSADELKKILLGARLPGVKPLLAPTSSTSNASPAWSCPSA